jgi:hypothetical protein
MECIGQTLFYKVDFLFERITIYFFGCGIIGYFMIRAVRAKGQAKWNVEV